MTAEKEEIAQNLTVTIQAGPTGIAFTGTSGSVELTIG